MEQINQNLQDSIQKNLNLLKERNMLPKDLDPMVSCACSLKTNKQTSPNTFLQYKDLSPFRPYSFENEASIAQVPKVNSQFQKVDSIDFKKDVVLHPVDPGNAPFILPAGVTPASILADQESAIHKMMIIAEEQDKAAQEARKKLLARQEAEALADAARGRLQGGFVTPLANSALNGSAKLIEPFTDDSYTSWSPSKGPVDVQGSTITPFTYDSIDSDSNLWCTTNLIWMLMVIMIVVYLNKKQFNY